MNDKDQTVNSDQALADDDQLADDKDQTADDKDQTVNAADQAVDGKGQPVVISLNGGRQQAEWRWAYDDAAAAEDRSADLGAGLVSLGFIKAAIRRGARFWCATTVAGLLAGLGVFAAVPPAYQASTSVFLTHGTADPDSIPGSAILDDQAIAQSRAVAGLAIRTLGLRQSVSGFLSAVTVTVISDRVLLITVSAPSSDDAVRRASALATAFLEFRADQLQTEQTLVLRSLDQQIGLARQHIGSISRQIGELSARPGAPAYLTRLGSLRTERNQAMATLTALEQTTNSTQAITRTATTSAVQGSQVLDAATPVHHSRLKLLLVYAAIGLLAGLALGIGLVVVRALMSDRLRRRDDVAHAIGAPVRLSVGSVRLGWRLPGRRGLTAARGAEIGRIVAHLARAVPASSSGTADPPRRRGRGRAGGLAVVPVDDPKVAALSLASLAVSCAQQGKQVVLADLCGGAPAARLLGASSPGVRTVSVPDAQLVVAVPDRDDVVPAGPLDGGPASARNSSFSDAVADSCASADLLLTLAALDPSLGGEHLGTWATAAVAMVTAGHSSATRIHAVGEMIRFAGTALDSAVLVGADRTDESLGTTVQPGAGRDVAVAGDSPRSEPQDLMAAVNGSPCAGPSDDLLPPRGHDI